MRKSGDERWRREGGREVRRVGDECRNVKKEEGVGREGC